MALLDSLRGGFRNEMLSTLQSMAPYSSRNMVDMISVDNPKYKDFHTKGTRREELLSNHSISQGNPFGNANHPMGDFGSNGDYHTFMYANIEPDKGKRLSEYRLMSGYDFISTALDEICDEFIVIDDREEIINFRVDERLDKASRKTIMEEFTKFVQHFDLENKGWEYCRNLLVDGELFFENVIADGKEDKGILGIVSIPNESIDPIFNNVQNLIVRGYLMRKPIYDEAQKQVKEVVPIVFDTNQVTYFNSNEWNEQKTFRLPHVEKARRAYKQLNMIEDSIVIHRLVNAPEKLVFKVDVGNMSQPQAERYLQQLAQRYWSKKTYDSNQGGVNMFNPQSMLDAFWFPKRAGSEGTDVSRLQNNGGNLGDLPDLAFFTNKLYKSLSVPVTRLTESTGYSDGTDMLREELKFARFIIRLQRQFSETMKRAFITHLKLRGWWEEYKLRPTDLKIHMNEPTAFNTLRKQQIFEIESNNYAGMVSNELISETYGQKLYLRMTDEEILANKEWLRKDMEFKWELQNIGQFGPDWRKQAENAEGQAAEDFNPEGGDLGGGGGGMGGETEFGGDGGSVPPEDFGAAPDAGGDAGGDAGTDEEV